MTRGGAPDDHQPGRDDYIPHHGRRDISSAESMMEYMQDEQRKKMTEYNDYLREQRLQKQVKLQSSRFLGDAQEGTSVNMRSSLPASRGAPMRTSLAANKGVSMRASLTANDNGRRSIMALSMYASRKGFAGFQFEGSGMNNLREKEQSDDEETRSKEVNDEENCEDETYHHGHNLSVPFYSRPVQRQMWDDDQVLPHVNWGDLFFDLFYVAAAYNLGAMLISAMESDWPRGVVYFIAMFGPLYNIWQNDVVYSSRYTLVDYVHRIISVCRFACVASAVLAIKPLLYLTDKGSAETVVFTTAIFCESFMQLGLHLELYFYGEGDRKAIQHHTKLKIFGQVIPATLAYMVASIIAAVSYFSTYYSSDPHRSLGEATPTDCDRRMLAGGGGSQDVCPIEWSLADVPLCICLAYYILNILHELLRKYKAKKGGDLRDRFVPNNIDYMIHRYGEWVILMIGESVLSLLIVETTEKIEYYVVAGLGILTVILLQTLKFESEPSHADGHALWRSIFKASIFSLMIQVLSMGLIAFGVSYKIMLSNIVTLDENRRALASVPYISIDVVAGLFSGSLTLVLLSMEVMMATHKDVSKMYGLFFHELEELKVSKLNKGLIAIGLVKLFLIVFTATLSIWVPNQTIVTTCGFVVVLCMCLTRFVGWGLVHYEEHIIEKFTTIKSLTRDAFKRSTQKINSSGKI